MTKVLEDFVRQGKVDLTPISLPGYQPNVQGSNSTETIISLESNLEFRKDVNMYIDRFTQIIS